MESKQNIVRCENVDADERLIDTLIAISVVAKRLAENLKKKNEE